jgi:hypothetical protein
MRKIFLFVFTVVLMGVQHVYGQCSQCKLLSEQGSSQLDEASFGTNINSGILYLMVIPYLILMFLFRKQLIGLVKGLIGKTN